MNKMKSFYDYLLEKKLSRSKFLKLCATGFSFVATHNLLYLPLFAETTSNARQTTKMKGLYDLVVAYGDDPYRMTVQAIQATGGMKKFVKKNSVVVIKPNIGWDRTPEQAADTNPQVVAALVELCYQAGARRVNVFDHTCNDPRRCYKNSGIEKAAKEKGAEVFIPDDWNVVKAKFPYKSPMEEWPIYRDALQCDTFINVPILKHHSLAKLTISIKNLMGVCAGKRGPMHFNLSKKLADLTDFIKPDLTVVDAYRVLMNNGPSGGNLDDVVFKKTLIVSTDPVLADAYACTVVDRDPLSISHIKKAAQKNLGTTDIAHAKMLKINTSP